MKKNCLVLMALLTAFSFVACSNPVGGGDNINSPQEIFTASPTDKGIVIKMSSNLFTSSSYDTYRIMRIDENNSRLDICGTNGSGKDLEIIDYFVDSGKTYTYEFDVSNKRAIDSQKRKITVKATNGIGDIKIKTEPKITVANNVLTFNTKPKFNDITGLQNVIHSQYLKFTLDTKYPSDMSTFNIQIPSNSNTINLLEYKTLWGETVKSIEAFGTYEIKGTKFEKYFTGNLITNEIKIDIPKDSIILSVLDYADTSSSMFYKDKNAIWDAFEKSHPKIKINREVLFKESFHQKTDAYVNSGKMPDVFYMWPAGGSTSIHTKHLAKDLMPFLINDGILNDYKEVCVDPKQQAGGYLAEIPFGLSTTNCVFVNKKVLKDCGINAPAKTYEELKEQVKILKKHDKKGIIMANQDDWVMQSCLFSMVLGRFGGETWARDIQNGTTDYTTSEPFRKAVTFIKQMYDDGVLTQETLGTNYGDVPGQFATEQGAYLIDGDWRCGAFITDQSTGKALIEPSRQASDIELIQFPEIPGEIYHNSNSGALSVGYGMSSSIEEGSEKEKAAWELIKWLSGPTVQQIRLDTGVSFPSLKEEKLDFSKWEPIQKKRSAWYGTTSSITPVFDAVMNLDISYVVNEQLQYLGLGLVSIDDVINNVNNGVSPKPESKPEEKLPTLLLTLPSRSKQTNEILEYNIRVLNISGVLVEERTVKGSQTSDTTNVSYDTLYSQYYNGAFRLNVTAKDSKNIYYNDRVYFVYVNDNSCTKETIELPNYKPIEQYYNSYVEKTDKGVKIHIPTVVENANLLSIRKINNETNSEAEIFNGVNSTKIYEDNHLNPNVEYTYIIRLDREDCVLDEKIINVTAPANSLGEITITNDPKAHFNRDTGELIFDEIPQWKDVNITSYVIEYVWYKNESNWNWAISSEININNINLGSLIRNPECYNKDIELKDFWAYINVDNNNWKYYIDVDKYNGLTSIKTINVQDNRFDIPKIENTTDGVEITLPTDKIPKGATKIVIGRENNKNKNNSKYNWGMADNYIYTTDLNKNSIKDIFVNNNEEYLYTIYYKNDNNKVLLKSKPSLHTTNIDTFSKIISNETNITYNETTNSFIFYPIPSPFTQDINIEFITKGDDNKYYWVTGNIKNDGTIDFNNSNILCGKEYTINNFSFNYSNESTYYNYQLNKDEIAEFNNLNKKIVLKKVANTN